MAPATNFANANTKGVQGPNLDLAFKQSVADGLGRSTIAGVVRDQIDLPMGPQMPADLYKGDDANDVAEYVASAIGKPARRRTAAAGPSGTAQADAKNVVAIPTDPNGQLAYQVKKATAKAGQGHAQLQERLLGAARHRDQGRRRGPRRPGRQDLRGQRRP